MEWSESTIALAVAFRPMGKQHLRNAHVAIPRCRVEGRIASSVLAVDRCSMGKEQLYCTLKPL
eukprot:m.214258 g.214258  ORF g.214258 m.214258 type:complete len:63 (-) comp10766_c0_seq5:191-379(-)